MSEARRRAALHATVAQIDPMDPGELADFLSGLTTALVFKVGLRKAGRLLQAMALVLDE